MDVSLNLCWGKPLNVSHSRKKIECRENSFEHSKVSFFSSCHIIIIALLFLLLHISGSGQQHDYG